jgi:transposase InsO family protein
MLDQKQIEIIPKNTRSNWNKFKHTNYDYDDWVKPFLIQFEDIKTIYMREHLRKSMILLMHISNGYMQVMKSITKKKTLLKTNSKAIVNSIDTLVSVSKLKINRICAFYGFSKDWYYREKRKLNCMLSPFKRCYKQHPNQLSFKEVFAIEQVIFDVTNYGKRKTTLYYQAMRNGLINCAKSTFNKYATALGYQKPKHKKKIAKVGFRATRVFEWLHVDITYVPTLEDGMQKVAFVKDNFSKAILHCKSTSGKADSHFITELFKETFEKFNLFNKTKPINIVSDGGSENKGELLSWIKYIKAPPLVNKITARTQEFPFSNNMAESTHSIYKTEFLKKELSKTIAIHLENLKLFVDYYNNKRFPTELFGLTPLEVVNGKTPDKYFFKDKIEQARKDRIFINQKFKGCPMY